MRRLVQLGKSACRSRRANNCYCDDVISFSLLDNSNPQYNMIVSSQSCFNVFKIRGYLSRLFKSWVLSALLNTFEYLFFCSHCFNQLFSNPIWCTPFTHPPWQLFGMLRRFVYILKIPHTVFEAAPGNATYCIWGG